MKRSEYKPELLVIIDDIVATASTTSWRGKGTTVGDCYRKPGGQQWYAIVKFDPASAARLRRESREFALFRLRVLSE